MTGVTAVPAALLDLLNAGAAEGACCASRSHLLQLMREDAWLYQGKGADDVERLRAFVAVKLAESGLADELIPYAVEELETGANAYAVAGAARVLRQATSLPAGLEATLARAIDRIRPSDDFVQFDRYPDPARRESTTAVAEVRATLSSLVSGTTTRTHSCCGGHSTSIAGEASALPESIAGLGSIELQNQDRECCTFADVFEGRTSLIAFFYTRCANPDKCSRTISQLAEVQRIVRDCAPRTAPLIAGITYDPEYDLPERLSRYGTDRGLMFDRDCQLLRTTGSFEPVRNHLNLGVGYGSATVNRHRIELLLVGPTGALARSHLRRLWEPQEIANRLLDMPA